MCFSGQIKKKQTGCLRVYRSRLQDMNSMNNTNILLILNFYRFIQILWSLEISETHVGRSHSAIYNVCTADLTVPVLHGAVIEGVATMVCRLGSRLIAQRQPKGG